MPMSAYESRLIFEFREPDQADFDASLPLTLNPMKQLSRRSPRGSRPEELVDDEDCDGHESRGRSARS